VTDLCVNDADESAALIRAALGGDTADRSAKARSIIAMNAGAGLYVGGQAGSLEAGIELAMEAMRSGKAIQSLEAFAERTQAAGGV
jgi:anthranilate phosphoribosyltransferase